MVLISRLPCVMYGEWGNGRQAAGASQAEVAQAKAAAEQALAAQQVRRPPAQEYHTHPVRALHGY